MTRTRIGLFASSLFLVADPAICDTISSGGFFLQPAAPPASLIWEVAAHDGRSVTLEMVASGGGQIAWLPPVVCDCPPYGTNGINAGNAPAYKMDWAAWSAALADPAFSRSIIHFAGQRQEQPLARLGDFSDPFALDAVVFFVQEYHWPPLGPGPPSNFSAAFIAGERVIVPEPATLVMACTIALHLFAHRRSRPFLWSRSI
jgi:hypothetical protein